LVVRERVGRYEREGKKRPSCFGGEERRGERGLLKF
jgi:hypothetical protein